MNIPELCNLVLGAQALVTGVVAPHGESLGLGSEEDMGSFNDMLLKLTVRGAHLGIVGLLAQIQQVVLGRDSAILMSSLSWSKRV